MIYSERFKEDMQDLKKDILLSVVEQNDRETKYLLKELRQISGILTNLLSEIDQFFKDQKRILKDKEEDNGGSIWDRD